MLDEQAPRALHARRVLIEGVWHDRVDPEAVPVSRAPGPARALREHGDPASITAAGRYHLYVSYACPFAHRAILVRALKGLELTVSMSVAHPHIAGPHGWTFGDAAPDEEFPEVTRDEVTGSAYLYDVYRRSDARFTGRVTIPVLWDRETTEIVSNDSSRIMRLLATGFEHRARTRVDLVPAGRLLAIDRLNDWLSWHVNSAVYRVGTAPNRASHQRASARLLDAFAELERHLADRCFLLGDAMTESDLRLFATLVRIEIAYAQAFCLGPRPLGDFPRLRAHTERLLAVPAIAGTVKADHIRRHYLDDDTFRGNATRAPAAGPVEVSEAAPRTSRARPERAPAPPRRSS